MPVLDYQVAANEDDGYWESGIFTDNNYLVLGSGTHGVANVFARWDGVTIPSGATITAAYVSFYYQNDVGTPPACALYFEKAADPLAISSANDGNGRAKTTASISITSPESGTWWNSDDISSIIQELVDAYSYVSGAAMQMIIIGGGSGSNYGYERACNYIAYGPKLHIEYTSAREQRSQATFRGMFSGIGRKMR